MKLQLPKDTEKMEIFCKSLNDNYKGKEISFYCKSLKITGLFDYIAPDRIEIKKSESRFAYSIKQLFEHDSNAEIEVNDDFQKNIENKVSKA